MTETVTDQAYTIFLTELLTVNRLHAGRIKGSVHHNHFSNCKPFFPK